jgi:hypothetical protein
MAEQNASAVAITGGSADFTGNLGTTANFFVTGTSQLFNAVGIGSTPVGGQQLTVAGTTRLDGTLSGTVGNFSGNLGIGGQLLVTGTSQLAGTVGLRLAPAGNVALSIDYTKGSVYGIVLHPNDSDSGVASAMLFSNLANTPVGSITTTASATAYNTSSDRRLKESIAALFGALDVIRALKPVSFRWQADGSKGNGFLAHELMKTIPEAVSGLPDEVNEDGTIKPQQVDNSKIVVWLVGAMQEMAQRLEIVEAQLAALTAS